MNKALHKIGSMLFVAAGVLLALALRDRLAGPKYSPTITSPPEVATRASNTEGSGYYLLGLDGNRRGPDDASVTMVVFTNYECSHCAAFEATLEALLSRYPDELTVVTKHYAPGSQRVAIQVEAAADCAADQGQFGSYHRKYFQSGQGLIAREPWLRIGRQIGIADSEAFVTCVRSSKYRAKVLRHTAEAESLGVDATPTSFVNGTMVVGDAPFKMMDKIIGQALRHRIPANYTPPSSPATPTGDR